MAKYDSPNYTVIEKDRMFEVRTYEAFYTSSVVESDLRGYSGFGILFSYISGNNVTSEKMSMTVPVINTFDQNTSMEFVIPKDKVNQIPKPNNDKLSIKRYDEHVSAVIRFSGSTHQKSVLKHQQKLANWIEERNFSVQGPYQLARFNPPFSIPCLRRNEIMIQISYHK